jgi:hypothetical protein
LALPQVARADRPGDQSFGGTPASASVGARSNRDEARKHFNEVDLYLKDAENNARVLSRLSVQPGPMDQGIVREDIANLDRALSNADRHLSHLRALPSGTIGDQTRLDKLQRDLGQARAQLSALRSSTVTPDRTQLNDAAGKVTRILERADESFATIASSLGFERVDQMPLDQRHPVRGSDRDTGSDSELDMLSPQLRGRGIDEGFGVGNGQSPDRPLPSPSAPATPSSPEPGVTPRY